jgi:hypothetical protein
VACCSKSPLHTSSTDGPGGMFNHKSHSCIDDLTVEKITNLFRVSSSLSATSAIDLLCTLQRFYDIPAKKTEEVIRMISLMSCRWNQMNANRGWFIDLSNAGGSYFIHR